MTDQLRVLIAGGRDYEDRAKVEQWLEVMLEGAVRRGRQLVIIHGKSPGGGVDLFAAEWAQSTEGVIEEPYPVLRREWNMLGNMAPVRRNQRMLDEAAPIHFGMIFPGKNGTRDMRKRLETANIPIIQFTVSGERI